MKRYNQYFTVTVRKQRLYFNCEKVQSVLYCHCEEAVNTLHFTVTVEEKKLKGVGGGRVVPY